MPLRLALCLLLAYALPAAAQPAVKASDSWVIPVMAAWSVGDGRFVEVVEGTRRYTDGALTAADSSTTRFRVLVTEAGDDYYRVRWFTEDYTSSEELPDFEVDERLMLRAYEEGLSIQTNRYGAFQHLDNRATMRRIMHATLDGLLPSDASATDAEEHALTRDLLERLGGVDFLVDKIIAPIQLYYNLHGYEWTVGAHPPYDDEWQLGGRSVRARGTGKVSEVDLKAGTFAYTSRLVADAASLREAVAGVIVPTLEAAGGTDGAWEQEMEGVAIAMHDVNRYLVDALEGWVLQLDQLRVIEAEGDRREQFLRMRVLTD